jgi:hypothetical protein
MKSPNTSKESFKEDFLHYIWKFQYFNKSDAPTQQGESVTILDPGYVNLHAGPDFTQAKILLNEVEWHGHVEIHYKASDWTQHQHQKDPAYNNVILHVVWENDTSSFRQDGSLLPVLVLKGRVKKSLIDRYSTLLKNIDFIPCAASFPHIDDIYVASMVERSIVERLESKSEEILGMYEATKNNWEETAYRWLGKCYGFKVNSDAFLKLCEVLPYSLLKKYRHNATQLEALVFGCTGFLEEDMPSNYHQTLQNEFQHLRQKHAPLSLLGKSEWKFLRLRPANFPTLRLAQFSSFHHSVSSLFDLIFSTSLPQPFLDHCTRPIHSFWKDHYLFDKPSYKSRMEPHLGMSSAENILMNGWLPLRFAYAHFHHNTEWKNQILDTFRMIKAEKNSILEKYSALGASIPTAYEAQAFLQLHRYYCSKRKCLSCQIGHQIMFPS